MSNMFNDYQKDFKEQEKQIQERSKSITPVMVGSAPVKILAINPTENELVELIGEGGKKFDTKYNRTPSQYNDNKPSRPIAMWITDAEEQVSPVLINFNLIDTPRLSRDGKPQWWNVMQGDEWNMLTTRWSYDLSVGDKETKTSKSGNSYTNEVIAPVLVGQENYYRLLYTILKWPDASTFMEAIKKEKLDFKTVYDGDFSGLHNLVKFLNAPITVKEDDVEIEKPNSKTFMGIFTAKLRDDGTVRQSFAMNPDTWFVNNYDVLTKGMKASIKQLQEDRLNRDGLDIIKDQYTIEPLTKYNEEVVKKTVVDTEDVDEWFN